MSDEGEKTCPLCAEEMDLTDQQLKPCKCGYEICVWCWHHIMDMAEKDDTEGRCPACRSPYDKEKIVGMAANCGRLVAEISVERKKSQKAKTKPTEGRKQLSSVRVIQRNLVYIVGLPLNLADEDLLQRREYFGQYGKVLKVSMSRTAAGVIQQFPNSTCSVYITYSKEDEAIRCIQSVHGFVLDGRSLKACFGTTKYCHAWLRNVPCTNPDCLYLHEIGSHEDSFTKDEIISAYTRSRVQQITGATSNMLRRAGSMLPPPLEDYNSTSSTSSAKPIVKDISNNTISTDKGSPPNGGNGSTGRSIALPAAASWGTRASSQPLMATSTLSNGPSKPKSETVNGTLGFSSAVASINHNSTLQGDVGKRETWNDDNQPTNAKGKPDTLKSVKHNVLDNRSNVSEKPDSVDTTATGTLSNQSSSAPASKHSEWGSSLVSNGTNSEPERGGTVPSDSTSVKIENNVRNEPSGVTCANSSLEDQSLASSPGSQGFQQSYDQYRDPLASPVTYKNFGLSEQSDWRTDTKTRMVSSTVSEVEEDIISFDNQRLKDPEVVSHTGYLPNSANSLHFSNHSRSHSFQYNDPFGGVNLNADPLYVDNRIGDRTLQRATSNTEMSNGYSEKLVSSSAALNRNMELSFSLPVEGEEKHLGRLQGDSASLDAGESSIISNILSLDLDSWDASLTSPQSLAKLLGETNKQPSPLKMPGSWKVQNNNQSRFSFARQEESRNQLVDIPTYSVFGQMPKNVPFSQDIPERRNSYFDRHGMSNGFTSSNFEESETFTSGPSVFPSNKPPSVARAQISAPPGFSVPNRAPPPGFSSHERMDQVFDISGNPLLDSSSLLRNSYQAPPTGNVSSSGDIEFVDPAILAVGKGRLQGVYNNPGLDMRSNFPQQLSTFENEARLQLLMQRSLSPRQNLRYSDIGDNFSSLTDSYGISSRLMDQSQMNNISPFMQMSHQHSRNGVMSNGHWDGWNEVQGGNNLGVAELLRNERLGLNKFYSSGYEDSKFRMPSSGDLYNRTFEM